MIRWLVSAFNDGLLAISVLCGPGIWFLALSAAYSAWLPGNSDGGLVFLLWLSFVFMSWAFWGIVVAPRRFRHWWFLLCSLLNMLGGIAVLVSTEPYAKFTCLPFLAYSLWQFFVSRRPQRPRVHLVQ